MNNLLLLLLQLFSLLLINFNYVLSVKFEHTVETSVIATDHGYLIGYFTFSGKGVAGLSYSISPLLNASEFKISVFPMAYDSYSNLQRITRYYSQASCKEFYQKSIYTVNIIKSSANVPLGRFSGGFAVSLVLSDKYVCPPNIRRLDIDENIVSKLMKVNVDVFNPDENGVFTDHLSATDKGIRLTLRFLLLLYTVMGLWAAYNVCCKANLEIPMFLIIQKIACLMILMYIFIYIFLLASNHRLQNYGTKSTELELAAELLANICRYMELYIVVSWTLSSQRDSSRSGADIVARIIGGCAVVYCILMISHYWVLTKTDLIFSCSTVWDCETHLYTTGAGFPVRYGSTTFGLMLLALNWLTSLGASLFVMHLLRLGLGISEICVRRAYLSVFCSVALLWFWSYPIIWLLSGLMTDYYQYQFVLFMTSIAHLCALPALLRITLLKSMQVENSLPASITIYD